MTIEEFREALAHLPVFPHTPVLVTGDYNGVHDVARVDHDSQGVLIEVGIFSESEWAEMARARVRERDEQLRACTQATSRLVNDLVAGKPPAVRGVPAIPRRMRCFKGTASRTSGG